MLRSIAAYLGASIDELLRIADGGKPAAPEPHRTGSALPAATQPKAEVFDVPVIDARFSMGLGASMPEADTVVDHLRLAGTWVRQNLPGVSSTLNLAVVTAYGKSMEPYFSDGDVLLVDRGVHELKADVVYALAFRDELYIKQVQRFPDGSVKIISVNKTFEPIVVPKEEVESVRVLGRVIWAWNGKKM